MAKGMADEVEAKRGAESSRAGDAALRETTPDRHGNGRPRRARKRSAPRPVSPDLLERWALAYLQRYATSAANLRAVLRRKAERNASQDEPTPEEVPDWIDDVVGSLERAGYVDDEAYATSLAQRLHARGGSQQLIRARLHEKGLSAERVAQALERTGGEAGDFAAACRYARRRGLGPFRTDPALREQRRERDLAAFARAGFSYEVTSRVLAAKSASDLEES